MKTNLKRQLKSLQSPLEKFVFPVILLLWPLAAASQGVSVMDTTYSLTNYAYPESIGPMWRFATFLANVLGSVLIRLPAGRTMLGMTVMCLLLISAAALTAYYTLGRMIPKWMMFIGEMIAISYCWCPAVILYNYLTYLLLAIAGCLLFLAVSDVEEHRGLFMAAGALLGLNVLSRFANLTQPILILAVIFYGVITERSAKMIRRVVLWCVLGYVCGFGAGYLLSALLYGPSGYWSMIPQLFSSAGSAQSYTAGGMISSILSAYAHSLEWFAVMGACAAAGMIWFALPIVRRIRAAGRILYAAGILVLFRFFYGRGMFTANYQDYGSMFEWGMMLVIMTLILCVIDLTGAFNAGPEERFLSAVVLLEILILPFGSNNYTYPVLNCMFMSAPFMLWMFRRIWQETRYRDIHFAWHSMGIAVIAAAIVQGGLFHCCFAFRDGTDGTARTAVMDDSSSAAGMYTTPENAKELEDLFAALRENSLQDRTLITFGNIPGLYYLCGMEPALDTAWPDLDSYSTTAFSNALSRVDAQSSAVKPVIILHHEGEFQSESGPAKLERLQQYIRDNGYKPVYDSDAYTVLTIQ